MMFNNQVAHSQICDCIIQCISLKLYLLQYLPDNAVQLINVSRKTDLFEIKLSCSMTT